MLRAFTILVGENEQKRLASAIQCVNSELPEDVALIRHCRTQPDPHVPSQFLFLNDFPLNANGKLDRVALSSHIEQTANSPVAETTTTVKAPDQHHSSKLSGLQRDLIGIWAKLLNRPHLTGDENFFDVGGHSLLAIRLLHQMKSSLSLDVTLAQLLRTPTVNSLALAKLSDHAIVVDKGLTKIRDGDGPENIFLIPPAGCSLVYFKPLTEFLNPRFNVYSICLLYTSPSPRDLSTSRMPSSA